MWEMKNIISIQKYILKIKIGEYIEKWLEETGAQDLKNLDNEN